MSYAKKFRGIANIEIQVTRACKNCRYYTDEVLALDCKEYRFCAQSTEYQKQYTKPDDWCDRFTGASWVNNEDE